MDSLTAKNGGGKVYRKVINRGPEKDRAQAWSEVVQRAP